MASHIMILKVPGAAVTSQTAGATRLGSASQTEAAPKQVLMGVTSAQADITPLSPTHVARQIKSLAVAAYAMRRRLGRLGNLT